MALAKSIWKGMQETVILSGKVHNWNNGIPSAHIWLFLALNNSIWSTWVATRFPGHDYWTDKINKTN